MSRESDDHFVPFEDLGPKHGIGFTRVHIRRLIRSGNFPAPYELSPNRIGWLSSELAAWKASRPRRVASG